MESRICTICARAGSKGVKGKNMRPLLGKPLLIHTLDQARSSGIFDAVAVSSDSAEILEASRSWGVDYLVERPAELASDTAPKIPAIRHAVVSIEQKIGSRVDIVCDLDATAPLRTPDDIRGAVSLLEESGATNVISVVPARRSPYFNMVEEEPATGVARLAKPLPRNVFRRQDAPVCYDMNASIYVWRRDVLDIGDTVFHSGTRLFKMRPLSAYDIDDEIDFALVEMIMSRLAQ